jgi:hypothetical protein
MEHAKANADASLSSSSKQAAQKSARSTGSTPDPGAARIPYSVSVVWSWECQDRPGAPIRLENPGIPLTAARAR